MSYYTTPADVMASNSQNAGAHWFRKMIEARRLYVSDIAKGHMVEAAFALEAYRVCAEQHRLCHVSASNYLTEAIEHREETRYWSQGH